MTKGYPVAKSQIETITNNLDMFPSQIKQLEGMADLSTTTIRRYQREYEKIDK